MVWCDLDLTFDIAVGPLVGKCRYAKSYYDLGVTFDLGSAKMFLLPYLRHISPIIKITATD